MSAEPVTQPRHRTKQEFVYQSLRSDIMHGALPPGARLRIEEIAQRLGVSPIPVREALHMLQSERLVHTVPHVGATVAAISAASIVEIFTVMEGLELVATRSAARRLTAADRQQLHDLLAALDRAIASAAYDHWDDLNTRFHATIAQLTAMPMLHEMTARVLDQWDRVRRFYLNDVLVFRLAQAQQEHHQIVQAMEDRDDDRLAYLVRAHNQGALAAYTEHLAKNDGAAPDELPTES